MRLILLSLLIFLCTTTVYAQFETAESADKLRAAPRGQPWERHTIDNGSRGADGVRVADINADGLKDLVTGWEEGGQVRLYVNPGPQASKRPWPKTVVGKARSVEDAVFTDLDSDGKLDIVASCEGTNRRVLFYQNAGDVLGADSWQAEELPVAAGMQQWMFALPLQIDGEGPVDLVLGSKGAGASVGWLQAPLTPDIRAWQWHPMSEAGWVMSLRSQDVDHDGDMDVVLSDRKGNASGCYWLENPGVHGKQQQPWNRHLIVGESLEVMFMELADINGDGRNDVATAVRAGDIRLALRTPGNGRPAWEAKTVLMPKGVGTGKAVAALDVDLDDRMDLVVTCENAADKIGVFWMRQTQNDEWLAINISGQEEGVKFDRIEVLDLDADGDLDVITCEERDNLGVIWYENPAH